MPARSLPTPASLSTRARARAFAPYQAAITPPCEPATSTLPATSASRVTLSAAATMTRSAMPQAAHPRPGSLRLSRLGLPAFLHDLLHLADHAGGDLLLPFRGHPLAGPLPTCE